MSEEIISVTFEKRAMEYKDGHFSVPTKVCELLGFDYDDDTHIVISHPRGTILFAGNRQMKSGYEFYGKDFAQIIKGGDRIRVTISKP